MCTIEWLLWDMGYDLLLRLLLKAFCMLFWVIFPQKKLKSDPRSRCITSRDSSFEVSSIHIFFLGIFLIYETPFYSLSTEIRCSLFHLTYNFCNCICILGKIFRKCKGKIQQLGFLHIFFGLTGTLIREKDLPFFFRIIDTSQALLLFSTIEYSDS